MRKTLQLLGYFLGVLFTGYWVDILFKAQANNYQIVIDTNFFGEGAWEPWLMLFVFVFLLIATPFVIKDYLSSPPR